MEDDGQSYAMPHAYLVKQYKIMEGVDSRTRWYKLNLWNRFKFAPNMLSPPPTHLTGTGFEAKLVIIKNTHFLLFYFAQNGYLI